jgi:amidase
MRNLFIASFLLFTCACQKEAVDDFPLHEMTITELQAAYADGRYTTTEVVSLYLDRIDELNRRGPELRAIISVNPAAMQIAHALDDERAAGNVRSPLHGIPVILKDNIESLDEMPTTAGARIMRHSFPGRDATIVDQLRAAGAVVLGKANLSEWANFHSLRSSSGWSGLGGQTRNPYDISRNPCGSSSGSAVAVAANLTMLAIGTETNGSIVCPANNNGIVGIKPTVGLASRTGIIPISFTQDTPGPMARSLSDAVICLNYLTASDSNDSKTLQAGRVVHRDYRRFLTREGLQGKRLGIYQAALGDYLVDPVFAAAVEDIRAAGAEVIPVVDDIHSGIEDLSFQLLLFEFKQGVNDYFASLGAQAPVRSLRELIAKTEADSISMRFHDYQLLQMAAAKSDVTSPQYRHLRKQVQNFGRRGIDSLLRVYELDALIAPSGAPAWKIDLIRGDNFGIYSSSPAAIAGYPNISVPMGFVEGLPVGISFFASAWSEAELIAMAYAYEQQSRKRRPPVL